MKVLDFWKEPKKEPVKGLDPKKEKMRWRFLTVNQSKKTDTINFEEPWSSVGNYLGTDFPGCNLGFFHSLSQSHLWSAWTIYVVCRVEGVVVITNEVQWSDPFLWQPGLVDDQWHLLVIIRIQQSAASLCSASGLTTKKPILDIHNWPWLHPVQWQHAAHPVFNDAPKARKRTATGSIIGFSNCHTLHIKGCKPAFNQLYSKGSLLRFPLKVASHKTMLFPKIMAMVV